MPHQDIRPVDTSTRSSLLPGVSITRPYALESIFPFGDDDEGMVQRQDTTYPSALPSTRSQINQVYDSNQNSIHSKSLQHKSDDHFVRSRSNTLGKSKCLTNSMTSANAATINLSKCMSFKRGLECTKSLDHEFSKATSKDSKDNKGRQNVSALGVFSYADCADIILLILGVFFAVACGLSMPLFAFFYGKLIYNLSNPKSKSEMHAPVYLMLYLGLGTAIVSTGRVFCWTLSASRQVSRIQRHFFKACLRQDIGWHDLHSPGMLTSRMSGDTRVIHNGINEKFAQGIMNFFIGVFGMIMGLILSWELALLMSSLLPIMIIVTVYVGKRIKYLAEASRKDYAVAGSIATEVISNIKIVQAFGKEESEMKRFNDAALNAQRLGMKMSFLTTITPGIFMALCLVLYCVAFIFASYLVQWGRARVDDIISTFISLLISIFSFSSISINIMAFVEARTAAHEIFQVIESTPEIDIDADGEPVNSFNDAIEFRHVTFSYPTRPDMVLFRDLNLTIRKGQKIAFSGASGCGKSSIIGLILRFYDPNEGQLFCDGVDLRRLLLKDWRSQIGIVSQEPNLFAGSIIYNVRLGKPTASYEEVVEACKKANIHDTIMSLSEQYDTSVGAVGTQLSGGQKQRIAIARALIKKPSILLLDEATSALDLKSEMKVQEALDGLIKDSGMTVIIVSHRLSTIRDVDYIYYIRHDDIEGSIITESGTFDELIARNGEFAAMASVQGASSKSEEGTKAKARDAVEKEYFNVVLDDEALSKLEAEAPLTERQKVPIEELASWEIKRTNVGPGRIISYCRDYTWAVILGLVGSAVSGAIFPTNNIIYGTVLSVFSDYAIDKDVHKLRKNSSLYAPLFLIFAVASFVGVYLQTFYGYTGQKLTTRIRTLLFSRVLQQDMNFFDIPGRDTGSLSTMLSGDCEAVHQLWGPSIGFKLQTLSALIAGIAIGFSYEWRLALVALACLPVVAGSVVFQDTICLKFIEKNEDTNESVVTESLTNIRTVASLNLKDKMAADFHELQANEEWREIKKSIAIAISYGVSKFVFYAFVALCYWYGGNLIWEGKTEFKNVIITIGSIMMASMEVGDAGAFATKVSDARKAARRIFSVVDRTPDIDGTKKGDVDIGAGCQVVFNEVRFLYPSRPKQVVLNSVSLQFDDATSNGLIGETGCGKSTIVQILARFYDKRSGRITVNGKRIEDIDITEWRKNISIVLQEPSLFSGTVRENIRYSRENATDEEVEAAAKLADIHQEILNWPEGYDTQVGYMGRGLSGGQKQRVAIARALLRRPKLLLLDEATSALDNATEARVQRGINSFQAETGTTTISIAHRLTTVRNCDRIILLHFGNVIEQGSHDELIRFGGKYKVQWEVYSKSLH